ncbi:MAG TPA: M61 family peptidase [Thermoanaerobaculia bacterium]|jgi:predicted metalloprotease with PDZ domain|nr:M61 family peptidase [Thermoanaerobaculia bacterium]
MLKRALLLLVFVAVSLHAQTIRVAVDATDAGRKLFHSHLTIPATPGPMKLVYAKWLPGEHGPTGPIDELVNVRITANGQRVAWTRDPRDMFVFHLDVPAGASALEVDATYLAPTDRGSFTAGPSATPNLAVLAWNTVLLFPPGKDGEEIMIEGSIRMPDGWTSASALKQTDGKYERASLTTYVDSPVIMGRYLKSVDIPSGNAPPHRIDIVSDSRAALETPPTFAADYGRLVAEAGVTFGAHHFRKYDWLLTLSDHVAHFGLEHHESSDNRMPEATLAEEDLRRALASLLSHEYVHSWNGKYRRPAAMLSPDYQSPMEGNLLWVYEGLTTYLGPILATRAGLWTPDELRELLATVAAGFDVQPGRTWRPLADTAVSAQVLFSSPDAWRSLRRGVDFYDESVLLWLEVDSIIRQQTNGRASLDNFTRRFHGGETGKPALKPYTFDDLVNTLNAIAPYDWRKHFEERLTSLSPRAPIGGLTYGGWEIAYNETENELIKVNEKRRKIQDLTWSLGIVVKEDGVVRDALLGLPAANAGIGPGMKIVAVNGRKWKREVLAAAIKEAKTSTAPIELLVENNEFFRTHAVDYHGGLRYPHLVRTNEKEDRLAAVLRSRVK